MCNFAYNYYVIAIIHIILHGFSPEILGRTGMAAKCNNNWKERGEGSGVRGRDGVAGNEGGRVEEGEGEGGLLVLVGRSEDSAITGQEGGTGRNRQVILKGNNPSFQSLILPSNLKAYNKTRPSKTTSLYDPSTSKTFLA